MNQPIWATLNELYALGLYDQAHKLKELQSMELFIEEMNNQIKFYADSINVAKKHKSDDELR